MDQKQSHGSHAEFACPMHPDVKGNKGDRCPKCGMMLERLDVQSKVAMTLTTNPQQIDAGKPVLLSFKPVDESDENVVVELDETHERKIHIINISEDLSWFNHIHPELDDSGAYTVNETFPTGGNYLVYADYKPRGSHGQTDRIALRIRGAERKPTHFHEPKPTSVVDGYTLTVHDAGKLGTGSVLIPIVVKKDGKAVRRSDIQNYLGAVAHIILVSQDDKRFIHIHPESTNEFPIYAHADIPTPGIYRMWVQFQTEGTVHTADFTLNIKAGSGEAAASGHKHSGTGHKH